MNYPLIVSFYTNDWIYPEHANRLRAECDALGLQHKICEIPSTGYLQNCQKKPFFMRDIIQQEKRPILWVDVDASIYKLPEYFLSLTADASFKSQILYRTDRKWHVGTIWLNYTPSTLEMLDMWCNRVLEYNSDIQLTGDHSDESALNDLINNGLINAQISDMPKNYFYIDEITGFHNDAVIYHRISKGESKQQQSKQIGVHL